MKFNFKNMKFELVDLSVEGTPDMTINPNGITFTKKVISEMKMPGHVQFCIAMEEKFFAVKVCKPSDPKAYTFFKSRLDKATSVSVNAKGLKEIIVKMIPEYTETKRYRVTGEYDSEDMIMYFDMSKVTEAPPYKKIGGDTSEDGENEGHINPLG